MPTFFIVDDPHEQKGDGAETGAVIYRQATSRAGRGERSGEPSIMPDCDDVLQR
jgi:hypothetical protein